LPFRPLDFNKRSVRNREKGITWPLGEPIDGTAVDQAREHTASRAERVAYRTHAQHDVEVVSDSVDEKVEYAVAVAFCNSGLFSRRSTADYHALVFVRLEQIRHFTAVQDVVDVFEELFNYNL
jgi:hypothetical protein